MRMQWEGFRLDGRTAARQPVTIQLMREGLEISAATGERAWWPYAEIRQTSGTFAGEPVRLERGGELAEVLLVADPRFLRALREVAPEAGRRFHDPTRRRLRVPLVALAALGVVGITTALYLWGIPAVARVAATRVPVTWEERLGQAVFEQLAPADKRCQGAEGARALGVLVAALTRTAPATGYTFRVAVVDEADVNALAAPGGYVILLRGLIERARSPEEVAGVLAHELQHVIRRHPTRRILEHASTGLLVAALAGDPTGAMAYALETARTLGTLSYSRRDETEADLEGARMLRAAGIDPAAMVRFLESLEQDKGRPPELLRYLSTHPSTAERIRRLRELSRTPLPAPVPALDETQWQALRQVCAGMAPPR
jgi:predicted Zn-dependent protease